MSAVCRDDPLIVVSRFSRSMSPQLYWVDVSSVSASRSLAIALPLYLSRLPSLSQTRSPSHHQSRLISCSLFQQNIAVKPVSDKELIETARKHNLDPNSMKGEAFALFDRGYSLKEVRFLLRRHRNPANPSVYSATLRRYRKLWESVQK